MKFALRLSLIGKELIELSAAPRTYTVRVAWAGGLAVALACAFGGRLFPSSTSTAAVLGLGRPMFEALVAWQFLGVHLLLPAMVAPVVAGEREAGTYDLLLMSRLGLGSLLLQKAASRLIALGTVLLVALPLGAVAYSLGGIGVENLLLAAWCLLLSCIQVAAWSLWCGMREDTSGRAILRAYTGVPIALVRLGLLSLVVALLSWRTAVGLWPWALYGAAAMSPRPLEVAPYGLSSLAFSAWLFTRARRILAVRAGGSAGEADLVRPKPVFRRDPARDLAALRDRPVAWREALLLRRWHGDSGVHAGLFSILLGLLFILALVRCTPLDDGTMNCVGFLLPPMAIAAMALIAAYAATLFAAERSRQTLDVLLTMPFEPAEIVVQKFEGIRPLLRTSTIGLGAAALFAAAGSVDRLPSEPMAAAARAMAMVAAVALLVRASAWLGMLIGLRAHSPHRAAFAALLAVAAWIAVPAVALAPFTEGDRLSTAVLDLLRPTAILSPQGFPPSIELVLGLLDAAFLALLLTLLRRACLARADAALRAGAA